jgi:hypothetical protein
MKKQGVTNRGVPQKTWGSGCVCETPYNPMLRGRFSAAREHKNEAGRREEAVRRDRLRCQILRRRP